MPDQEDVWDLTKLGKIGQTLAEVRELRREQNKAHSQKYHQNHYVPTGKPKGRPLKERRDLDIRGHVYRLLQQIEWLRGAEFQHISKTSLDFHLDTAAFHLTQAIAQEYKSSATKSEENLTTQEIRELVKARRADKNFRGNPVPLGLTPIEKPKRPKPIAVLDTLDLVDTPAERLALLKELKGKV